MGKTSAVDELKIKSQIASTEVTPSNPGYCEKKRGLTIHPRGTLWQATETPQPISRSRGKVRKNCENLASPNQQSKWKKIQEGQSQEIRRKNLLQKNATIIDYIREKNAEDEWDERSNGEVGAQRGFVNSDGLGMER